ncbi:MAG: hypothetical protein BWK80_46415 [Desulfobacteraceae bacterium IS3]|nr:MAG: hypothetical protein BWK80_46415 [Desulfobacteraceae bacterium IS3]
MNSARAIISLWIFDATEACVGKSEGDACEMTMRDQAVSGICAADGENLVCRQNQPSDNMSGTAEEACVGKKEGDACEMTFQNQTVSGLCTLNREQLSCRTENPGGNLPPDNNFSSDACVGKSEGDACETTMREQRFLCDRGRKSGMQDRQCRRTYSGQRGCRRRRH